MRWPLIDRQPLQETRDGMKWVQLTGLPLFPLDPLPPGEPGGPYENQRHQHELAADDHRAKVKASHDAVCVERNANLSRRSSGCSPSVRDGLECQSPADTVG